MHVMLIKKSKLTLGMSVIVGSVLPCDALLTCPECTLSLIQ